MNKETKTIEMSGARIVFSAVSVLCILLCLFLLFFVHTSDDFALRFSAINGYPKFVKTLIYFGANVHAKNDEALRLAAWQGESDIVEILLNHGANVHASNDETLWVSAKQGRIKIIEALLDHGADIHAKNELALHAAVNADQVETVQILLNRGAEVSGCHGLVILHFAEKRGYTNIVDLLRKHRLFTAQTDSALSCSAEELIEEVP